MEALDLVLAHKTVKRYFCSNCWGELEVIYSEFVSPLVYVTCKHCKDETRGYVTQYFVNRRRGESEFQQRDVTRLLRKIGVLQYEKRSHETVMKELGF